MFGGHGSKAMRRIAKRLDDTQLILVCGHNSALADELRAMSARAPRVVVGFSAQIRYFMQLSDFFIGKPGPGSISEAIQQRLPVIVVRNVGPCRRNATTRIGLKRTEWGWSWIPSRIFAARPRQ